MHWRIQGGSKFFHFHAVFGKKLKNNSTFGSWPPPPGEILDPPLQWKIVQQIYYLDFVKMAASSVSYGKMIVCHSLNITIRRVGGVSLLRMFTTTRPHGYVNTTTWLGISQFF